MRKLPKPDLAPETVFLACISNIRDKDFKSRLLSCEKDIIFASQEFEHKAISHSLHTISPQKNVGAVFDNEMQKLYNDKMAKDGQPGRVYYNKIKNAAPQNTCPLCGQRKVGTVDHFLPKSSFPALAVAPINLIPCCYDCNVTKRAIQPQSAEQVTMHPYFDDFETDRWLFAEVLHSNPVSLIYFVNPPDHWGDVKKARVKHHFEVYKLATLYGSHAASELVGIKYSLQQTSKGGPNAVRDELIKSAISRQFAHKNSWDGVMYRTLSENEWFCTEGCLLSDPLFS